MGALLTAFLAYFGVYAGVLLGSLSAEELPIGRYRLRVFQLVLMAITVMLLIYELFVRGNFYALLFIAGFLLVELSFVIQQKVTSFSLHPKEKMLLTYGIFGVLVVISSSGLAFTYSALVFLYGLVTGSLIAEPFVEDRNIVPAKQPYIVAAKWTWSYLAAFCLVALIIFV